MRLLIDSGNTRTKYFLYDHGQKVEVGELTDVEGQAAAICAKYPQLRHVLVADVRAAFSVDALQPLFPSCKIHLLKSLKMPFRSHYTTPTTLGDDRLALVAAAMKKYPNQHCFIIDAGSCITFDLLTAQAEYLGGAISPGLNMRFKALNTFTGKLPLFQVPQQTRPLGQSTQEAIEVGVVNGVVHEINGQISAQRQKFPALTVILTGGDALYLSKTVKNTIFAEPNFLAEGLDFILEHNNF